MRKLYDFIVVGAGPAGALCSKLLKDQGYDVAILEARSSLKRKVCGEYLCPAGVELLQMLKIKEMPIQSFNRIDGMILAPSFTRKIFTFFPRKKDRSGGLSVNREKFDNSLLIAAQNSGVDVYMGHRVLKIKNESSFWTLNTGEKTFRSRVIIGADGRQSFVAKELGLSGVIDTSRVALHCYINIHSENLHHGQMHIFHDGSYIGIDPISEREVNFSLVCDCSKIKKFKNLEELLKYYINSTSHLDNFREIDFSKLKISTMAPITNKMKLDYCYNSVLLGDAGGFLDPLTGEGIYNALWTAKTFSDCVKKISNNSSVFDYTSAIKAYSRAKKRFFFQKTIINNFFQFLIRNKILIKLVYFILSRSENRANAFIGIIGNIYTPIGGFFKIIFNRS